MKDSLCRFLEAQDRDYETALKEITKGKKVSHWIWYVFPQLKGLGNSYNSEYYGIDSFFEAKAYLLNPILSYRLCQISRTLLLHKDKDIVQIVGYVDAMKIKSSMTLFDLVSPNDVFKEVLDSFFYGERCESTLCIVNHSNKLRCKC